MGNSQSNDNANDLIMAPKFSTKVSSDNIDNVNSSQSNDIVQDLIIKIGSKSFPANKSALMAKVEYFRNNLSADMREKRESLITFDPTIIDPEVFGDILDFIVTGNVNFRKYKYTLRKFRAFFKAADYLCYDELIGKATEYLRLSIDSVNMLLYRSIALQFDLKPVKEHCNRTIIRWSPPELLAISLAQHMSSEEEFGEFLEGLREVGRLEEMFDCCVGWISHDPSNRAGMLSSLLSRIPLSSLSLHSRRKIHQNGLVNADNECRQLLNSIQDSIDRDSAMASSKESLYAIGGAYETGCYLPSVSRYDCSAPRWENTPSLPDELSHFGCAVIDAKVYACGGRTYRQAHSTQLLVLDTTTIKQKWRYLARMKYSRYDCAAAALNGQLYVAGGQNGSSKLATVERYCEELDHWEEVYPMGIARSSLELVALDGYLYAIGGLSDEQGGEGVQGIKSVERYDPETDEWTRMADMNNGYSGFGSAVLNGYIYVTGIGCCEVYYPAGDRWSEIEPPSSSVHGAGRRLTAFNGQLIATGGSVGPPHSYTSCTAVMVFDTRKQAWDLSGWMNIARSFHGLAVVNHA